MNVLTSISLMTAFVGGMVALFAPCCITFLLPTYLANIFKTRDRVVWMTLIFGLGIATILVPTAIGIRAIGLVFERYHTQAYVIGGIIMILLGAMQLTGKKITLPMIGWTIDLTKKHDPWSIYLLGLLSGITTSCCTPVLLGVLTVSFLTPTLLWAAAAGVAYVAGMVFPLVVMAILLEQIQWTKIMMIKNKTVKLGEKTIPLTDAIAGVLFSLVGVTFATFALMGKITPGVAVPVESTLGPTLRGIVRSLHAIAGSEAIFGLLLLIFFIFIYLKGKKP